MAASCVRYGVGVTNELGPEMADHKFKKILLVTGTGLDDNDEFTSPTPPSLCDTNTTPLSICAVLSSPPLSCITHALVDSNLAALPPVLTAMQSLDRSNVKYDVYSKVRVEPTDESMRDAIEFAKKGGRQ